MTLKIGVEAAAADDPREKKNNRLDQRYDGRDCEQCCDCEINPPLGDADHLGTRRNFNFAHYDQALPLNHHPSCLTALAMEP